MKDLLKDEKRKRKAIDILDQCRLALKFYVSTQKPKYYQEFVWAVKRLHQLLKGDAI